MKIKAALLSLLLIFSSCNNTTKGGLIGGGGGAALGALIGALAGKGKGAAIGGAIGAAVGTGAGVLIGNRMDKAAAQAAAIAEAETEVLEDANGMKYVKVTFDSGILFATGKSELSTTAKSALTKFAQNVMAQNPDMDVAIIGYTDNVGFGKQYTAEQNAAKNVELSKQRAEAVNNFLKAQLAALGASSSQIKSVDGLGEANPVADNSTADGRQQNRRVEVFLVASDALVKKAQEQAS